MILLVHFDIRDWKSRCSKSPTCIGTPGFFLQGGLPMERTPTFSVVVDFSSVPAFQWGQLAFDFLLPWAFYICFLFTCPPRSSYFYLVCGMFCGRSCIQFRTINVHPNPSQDNFITCCFLRFVSTFDSISNCFLFRYFLYKFVILVYGFFFKVTEVWSLLIYLMQERGWWLQPNCLIYPPVPPPAVGRYIVPDRRLASAIHIGDICLCAVPPLRCP